jgi:hypothetical protein
MSAQTAAYVVTAVAYWQEVSVFEHPALRFEIDSVYEKVRR